MTSPDSVDPSVLKDFLEKAQQANGKVSETSMPSAKNLPILEFDRPMDLAVAVESLVLKNGASDNTCTPGHCLVASLVLLKRATTMMALVMHKKSKNLDSWPKSELHGILYALDEMTTLLAAEAALQSIVAPTVKHLVDEHKQSRGQAPDSEPLRVDYISTAALGALGIDHEAFDDHFKVEWGETALNS